MSDYYGLGHVHVVFLIYVSLRSCCILSCIIQFAEKNEESYIRWCAVLIYWISDNLSPVYTPNAWRGVALRVDALRRAGRARCELGLMLNVQNIIE